MTEDRAIRTVTTSVSRIPETLALAFQDDPALAWIVPDPERRSRMLPRFFEVMARQSRRYGQVLSSPAQDAAALLYPPGQVKDSSIWDSLALLGIFGTALSRGLKVAEAMHARHPTPQPYSYLRYVGVRPDRQGEGQGGIILRDIIDRAARAGRGVLLETATPDNVVIYSRLGFEITEEWSVPGGGPKFWTMVHPAP